MLSNGHDSSKKENAQPVPSALINDISDLLKKYIKSRAYEKGQDYELTFVSKHFRDEALTWQKVGIAHQLTQQLPSIRHYDELKQALVTAFNTNTDAEKKAKKSYVITGSSLSRVLTDIQTLIQDAEHSPSPAKKEG